MISTAVPTLLFALVVPTQAGASGAERGSELARVPFRSEAGLILVDVQIGSDTTATMLLDSGASNTVIERRIAEHAGLPMGPERGRNPASKRAEVTFRVISSATLRIGDYEFHPPQVIAAPCEGAARMMIGQTVQGILGHGFLATHTVEVDHEKKELAIHDSKTYRHVGEGTSLPVVFKAQHGNLPFTSVEIETESGETHSVEMLVDSGGCVLATMGLSTAAIIDAVVPPEAPRVAVQGATGLANDYEKAMFTTYATRLHRARIGPFVFDRPTSSCNRTSYTGLDLFGAEVLQRFFVVFDYERSRIILAPNSRIDEPPTTDRSGMLLVASEQDATLRRISFVAPESPAAEAGLAVNDVVLKINGQAADAQSLHRTRELFFELGEFQLETRRGEQVFERTLVARDIL